jgi:subtilisin family serine protease
VRVPDPKAGGEGWIVMPERCSPLVRVGCLVVLAASMLVTSAGRGAAQTGVDQHRAQTSESQRYIVVLNDDVESPEAAAINDVAEHGVRVRGVYSSALKGYSADVTPDEVARLNTDPDVAYLEPDRLLYTSGQVVPTGVHRVAATVNPNIDIDGKDDVRIDADVAVIDTGVAAVADLNIASRADCSTGSCKPGVGSDDNGHGTHVAGTIGALDNAIGVVGVAPGARIHALKVCNSSGECPNSAVLAAVDWVTAHHDTVEVANMSLGGAGTNVPLNQAIHRSADLGVVYVVAAGNNAADAAGFFPANSPDVIAVSALSDSDGVTGAQGAPPECRPQESDGRLATFSNFGAVVDVAAPGVCILSTWYDGGLKLMSGTSMASPHVAGAAAILASGSRGPIGLTGAIAIRQELVQTGTRDWNDTSGDGIKEPVIDVESSSRFPGAASLATTTPS